jgi:hypothetical protein
MSDQDYRCILRRIARVDSAKDLDEARFRKLMYFLVHSRYYRANAFGLTLRQKMFIDALVRQLDWDPSHLRNFVRKYYHRDGVEALTGREASHLIESLKAIRGQAPRPDEGPARGRRDRRAGPSGRGRKPERAPREKS